MEWSSSTGLNIRCRFVPIFILFFFPVIGECAELASWWQKTKYGNEFCNIKYPNGYIISIKCKDYRKASRSGYVVTNVAKWYFYKGHVVGEVTEKGQKRFFIFDETTCQSRIFQQQETFHAKVREEGLRPILWTRWYEENWGFFITDGDIGDGLNFIFFKLPALVVVGIATLIGLVRTRFNLRHPFNLVTLTLVFLIGVRFILDLFPGSI